MLDWLSSTWHHTLGNPHVWGFLVAIPFIVGGVVGTLLPVLPGTLLILLGFLVYGLCTGFDTLSLSFFVLQALLVGLSYLVDFLATAFGVKMYGGSRAAVWGAVLGSLLIFVIGPLGLLIGPLAGAVAGELLMGEQVRQAFKAGFGSFLGFIGGSLIKVVLAFVMIGMFTFAIL